MRTDLIGVEQAQVVIQRALAPVPPRILPLTQAFGCGLAQNITAPVSLPPFDNAAVDGYAVRAADVAHASFPRAVSLHVVEEIPAGRAPHKQVRSGEAARIFTGAPLPRGADTVVMQEDTDGGARAVRIFQRAARGENVRRAGEDVRAGRIILRRGEFLGAGALGLLAAVGISRVRVHPAPRVGVLVTGDEVIAVGRRLRRGQIYDSNSAMLWALIRKCGGLPVVSSPVGDSRTSLRREIGRCLRKCDAVIAVGGVSVGKYDLVKPVLKDLGARLKFWKVAMKPGKPFVFGLIGRVPFFGLPGNPVSAFVTFLLLVRPALFLLRGCCVEPLPKVEAVAAETFANRGDRRHFVRVTVRGNRVRSAGRQGAHMLSSLAAAHGLLDLSAGATVKKGARVRVMMISP